MSPVAVDEIDERRRYQAYERPYHLENTPRFRFADDDPVTRVHFGIGVIAQTNGPEIVQSDILLIPGLTENQHRRSPRKIGLTLRDRDGLHQGHVLIDRIETGLVHLPIDGHELAYHFHEIDAHPRVANVVFLHPRLEYARQFGGRETSGLDRPGHRIRDHALPVDNSFAQQIGHAVDFDADLVERAQNVIIGTVGIDTFRGRHHVSGGLIHGRRHSDT